MATEEEAGRHPCARLVRTTLSVIPSQLDRMALLASLQEPETGYYREPFLEKAFGRFVVDHVLSQEHLVAFRAWLKLDIEQQRKDLEIHLSVQPDRRIALARWIREKPYLGIIPKRASQAELQLFVMELETILELLAQAEPDI